MPRCEDYPCCGHENGYCPSPAPTRRYGRRYSSRTEPTIPARATFKFNQRLEVHFESFPTLPQRHGLKETGFQWDPAARCWHLARPVSLRVVRQEPISVDGWQYALDRLQTHLYGLTAEQAAELTQARDAWGHTCGVRGMEQACGI